VYIDPELFLENLDNTKEYQNNKYYQLFVEKVSQKKVKENNKVKKIKKKNTSLVRGSRNMGKIRSCTKIRKIKA
jgi:hypothetical protein